MLETVADHLTEALGAVGYPNALYRTGGEEFSIILHDIKDSLKEAERITRQLLKSLSLLRFTSPAGEFHVTVSIGEDLVLPSDENFLDVYERADQYLYQSKHNGRNAITLRGKTLTRTKHDECS